MKVIFATAARDDVIRQFRYYLVELNSPRLAILFRESVRFTVQKIKKQPLIAPPYLLSDERLDNLRSSPAKKIWINSHLFCCRQ